MQADNYKNNKQLPDGLSLFEASGFSMWPFLKTKDKLIARKIPLRDLKRGDIILYSQNGQLVCHRLIKKIKQQEKYLLYVRGDNSSSIEGVEGDMFRGKIISILRNNRVKNMEAGYQLFINQVIVMFNAFIRGSLRVLKLLLKGNR
jgi:hypothetical protein